MTTPIWKGDAPLVAQVRDANITGYDAGTTYKVTINGKTISTLGTGGSATTTATAFAILLNASTIPEFAAITWSTSTSHVIGAADDPGTQFSCTSSVSGGAGTMGAFSDTTANSGPADWSVASNWSTGAVPVNADDVVIDGNNPIYYGLDQSAVTLTSLTILNPKRRQIGLDEENAAGYTEYLPTHLKISATTITIRKGSKSGSGWIKLDTGSIQTALTIFDTGKSIDASAGLEGMLWKGTHAANVVNVLGGSLGIGVLAGDVATVVTLRKTDATVRCGSGCTLTTVTNEGRGALEIASAVTTLNVFPGSSSTLIVGAGAITTLNCYGTVDHQGTGTITTLNVGSTGNIDFDNAAAPITITNTNLYAKSQGSDTGKRIVFSNAFATPGCSLLDIKWDFGIGRTYLPT